MTDLLDRPAEVPTDPVDKDERDTSYLDQAREIVDRRGLSEAEANGLAADLAALLELADELNGIPGRPTVMKRLGVNDTRARKLKALVDDDKDPRTPPAGPGRASGTGSGVRFQAPAGDQHPPGAPAGAAAPHQPDTPPADDTTPAEQEQPPTTTPPPASPAGGGVVDTQPTADAPAPDRGPVEASVPTTRKRSAAPAVLMTIAGLAAVFAAHLVAPASWVWARTGSVVLAGLAVGTSITLLALRRRGASPQGATTVQKKVKGAAGYYLAAVISMTVSIDTSWRFFRDILHIENGHERVIMFAVLEVALLACGWGMRANVRANPPRSPGAPRMMAWLLCGFSGYMALYLSGPGLGLARVVLGPVIGIAMLEFALGIERHVVSNGGRVSTWSRVSRELRERVLSLLGLADDERDARARTRDRAVLRAARLAASSRALFRSTRLRRNLHKAGVAHDPVAQARMLAELAVIRHADDLINLAQPSPWKTGEQDQNCAGQS